MPGFIEDIQTMALLHFAIFATVLGTLTLYFFYLIWRNFHRARVIEDTPTALVRSAPQGYIELEGAGRTLPDQPVMAPLTNTPCVWYRFRIEKEKHGSRSGSNWSEVDAGSSETPFLFYDSTGECLVDPRKAEVTPGIKKVWYGSTKWPGVHENKGFFGELIGTRYRYTEERIDGRELYILGWFDTVRSTDNTVGAEVSALLKFWKQDQAALLKRFDADTDGSIDSDEWQTARQQAHREVIANRAARSAEAATSVIRAGHHDRYPFLISAKPQFLLASRYRRHALYTLLASLAGAGLLAWLFAVRF
jgi:E3 Ubiquitin ligase